MLVQTSRQSKSTAKSPRVHPAERYLRRMGGMRTLSILVLDRPSRVSRAVTCFCAQVGDSRTYEAGSHEDASLVGFSMYPSTILTRKELPHTDVAKPRLLKSDQIVPAKEPKVSTSPGICPPSCLPSCLPSATLCNKRSGQESYVTFSNCVV